MSHNILTLNPGSTSTKIVIFHGDEAVFERELMHPKAELSTFGSVWEQLGLRREAISEVLAEAGDAAEGLDAVVGRGGLTAPLPGGTYAVTEAMLEVLRSARHGEHPCNLGASLAVEFAERFDVPAFVVDPVVTDELCPEARLTGLPQIRRRSTFHALSQRGSAREAAARRGVRYEDGKFIVAHLGGGCSIGAHLRGRVVDVTNALDGEGPFTPERTGVLPVLEALRLVESGETDIPTLRHTILREGGLYAHLGTNDFREAQRRADDGDETAREVIAALAYNIAKHAASFLPVLVTADDPSPVDALVITGGLARSEALVAELTRRLGHLAPVEIILGLAEAQVMAQGAVAVLSGERRAKNYTS